MSEIVEELRNEADRLSPSSTTLLIDSAADLIEELESDLERSLKATLTISVSYEEVIEKLEEALRKIAAMNPKLGVIFEAPSIARRALEETLNLEA